MQAFLQDFREISGEILSEMSEEIPGIISNAIPKENFQKTSWRIS